MLEPVAAQFLRSLPLFTAFGQDSAAAIGVHATVHSYAKGSHIVLRGDRADYFYVVLSGWVKLYRETQDGDEAVIGLLGRNDTFGETAMFNHNQHNVSVQAVEDSKIIAIPARILQQESRDNFPLTQKIMQSFMQQINKLQLENEHLSLMSAPQRVGCLLLQFAGGTQDGAQDIHLPYEKSLAARKIGMKPETFSRALGQLRAIGVTVQGDCFHVPDIKRLIGFVCSDCSACDHDCPYAPLHDGGHAE